MENRSIIWVFICSFINFYASHGAVVDRRMKVIIDSDAGTDDAVAIALALAATEVDVIAITTSYGNTAQPFVEVNILKILTVFNRTDIPVYSGAVEPLAGNYNVSEGSMEIMGSDGFGDVKLNETVRGSVQCVDKEKSAAKAMVSLAKQFRGQINVLALGPLTNIAKAVKIDPSFTTNVKRFYSMGANFNCPGRKDCKANFNYAADPEANKVFFDSPVNGKTFILSSDILRGNQSISKDWRINVLGKLGSRVVNFLNRVERKILEINWYWSNADSITTALMIWPELVLDSCKAHIEAITTGEDRGKVVVDVDSKTGVVNAELPWRFDAAAYQSKLMQYFR